MKLKEALRLSLNSVAVQLTNKIGINKIILIANSFNIGCNRKLKKNLSIALGVDEQSLIDMTAAYAVISNKGYYIKPTIINEITDNNGNIIYSNNYENKKKLLIKK